MPAMDGRARVARNLRRIRTEQGISQENLAVDASVDRTYVGGIEREEQNPAVDVLDRLAAALRVDIVELFKPVDAAAPRPPPLKAGRRKNSDGGRR